VRYLTSARSCPAPSIQPHFTHKSYHVRELSLRTVLRLQELYGEDLMVMPDLCARVGRYLLIHAASHTSSPWLRC